MLVRKLNTDSREDDEGPLTFIARNRKGKYAIVNRYESNQYQGLNAIQIPYINLNFRITEGKK